MYMDIITFFAAFAPEIRFFSIGKAIGILSITKIALIWGKLVHTWL